MADDRLEDAMNIDRKTLRFSHPAYYELQVAIHKHLANLLKQIRNEIYGSGSKIRKTEKAEKIQDEILTFAIEEISKVSKAAAKEVEKAWSASVDNEIDQKKILRKFTVDQLYKLVVEVAGEVLTQEQMKIFLARLTEKLRQ